MRQYGVKYGDILRIIGLFRGQIGYNTTFYLRIRRFWVKIRPLLVEYEVLSYSELHNAHYTIFLKSYSSIFDTLPCYDDACDVRIMHVHHDTTICCDDDESATAGYLTPLCVCYMYDDICVPYCMHCVMIRRMTLCDDTTNTYGTVI